MVDEPGSGVIYGSAGRAVGPAAAMASNDAKAMAVVRERMVIISSWGLPLLGRLLMVIKHEPLMPLQQMHYDERFIFIS